MYKFMENHIAVSGGTEPTALTSWLPVLCFFKPRSCYPQTVLCVSASLFPGYDSSTPSQVNVARAVGEIVMESMAESLSTMCLPSPVTLVTVLSREQAASHYGLNPAISKFQC